MKALIQALSSIDAVAAVGLGGSRGLGLADENSDYDFVLFRHGGEHIAPNLIEDAIKPFVDPGSILVQANFVTTKSSGRKIEIFQKDLNYVEKEIALALDGKYRWSARSLLPHGYLSTGLITHIMYLELCAEKNNSITKLRRLAQPFPILLMRSLIETFLRQATVTVIHAGKIKKMDDFQYLFALCSAFVFYANIVIFAINKKYPVIERGGSRLIRNFPVKPKNYEERITAIFDLACRRDFARVSSELFSLLEEIRALADKALEGSKTSTDDVVLISDH